VGDLDGCHADGRDACQEIYDLLLVVGEAVGVEAGADGGVLRLLFLVLVEDPFERRAVAEPVLPGLGWDTGKVPGKPVAAIPHLFRSFRPAPRAGWSAHIYFQSENASLKFGSLARGAVERINLKAVLRIAWVSVGAPAEIISSDRSTKVRKRRRAL
jgi:hypothetical protein